MTGKRGIQSTHKVYRNTDTHAAGIFMYSYSQRSNVKSVHLHSKKNSQGVKYLGSTMSEMQDFSVCQCVMHKFIRTSEQSQCALTD